MTAGAVVRWVVATARAIPKVFTYWEIMDERAKMLDVLRRVFAEVEAEHALIGGLAVGVHGPSRATVDVDMLVPRRKLEPIAVRLEAHGFQVVRDPDFVRVWPPRIDPAKEPAGADLVAREANPVLRAAARAVQWAEVLGHRVPVVKRGALVALKFQAAVSPTRGLGDRYQDVADLARVIDRRFTRDDLDLAVRIVKRMHRGASREFRQLLADIRARRPVQI